jgi:hypothetical protein
MGALLPGRGPLARKVDHILKRNKMNMVLKFDLYGF